MDREVYRGIKSNNSRIRSNYRRIRSNYKRASSGKRSKTEEEDREARK